MAFTVKKQANLKFKKNTTFKIPRTGFFLPSSLGGLSLWLKADAGVSTYQAEYVSQIALSGATSSILNKTFVASGTPDPNNYYSYSFAENNGYFITYSQDDTPYYNLRYIAQGTGNIIILNSSDGISWSLVYNMPNTITISGITGTHSSANTTYNLYSYDGDNDIFYFPASGSDYYISTGDGSGSSSTNWFLYKVDPNSPYPFLISTGPLKSSAPSGSWTNNLSSGSPSSTYVGVANGTLPTGSVTTSEYGDFLVTEWADQSGNGTVLTPDIQNSPTFVSSFLNGKPAIEFTTNDNTGLSNTSFALTGFTFFSVAKQKPINGGRIFSSYFGNVLIGTWGNESNRFYGGNENGWLYEGTNQSTDFLITTAFSDTDTSFGFYQNGFLQSNGNSNSTVILNGISVGGGIWNGGNIEASDSYVCEIVIYNRTLTLTERQQVETYLNEKYGIY